MWDHNNKADNIDTWTNINGRDNKTKRIRSVVDFVRVYIVQFLANSEEKKLTNNNAKKNRENVLWHLEINSIIF